VQEFSLASYYVAQSAFKYSPANNHFERLNLGQHLTELTFWPTTGMSTKQATLTNTNPE
jgi:hypothetical protein